MVRWRSPIYLTLLLSPVLAACWGGDNDAPAPSTINSRAEHVAAPVADVPATVLQSFDARPKGDGGDAQKSSAPSPGSSDFSVLNTLEYSILREYERAVAAQGPRIRYPVCVTAEFSITDAQRQRYRDLEEQAINRWNDALQGAPGWRVQDISLYLVGGSRSGSCPRTDNGLRVYELRGLANRPRLRRVLQLHQRDRAPRIHGRKPASRDARVRPPNWPG